MTDIKIINGNVSCKNPKSGSVRINFRDGTQTHGMEDGNITTKITGGNFGEPFKSAPAKMMSVSRFTVKDNQSNPEKSDKFFKVESEVKAGFADISWHTEGGEILEILFSFIGQE